MNNLMRAILIALLMGLDSQAQMLDLNELNEAKVYKSINHKEFSYEVLSPRLTSDDGSRSLGHNMHAVICEWAQDVAARRASLDNVPDTTSRPIKYFLRLLLLAKEPLPLLIQNIDLLTGPERVEVFKNLIWFSDWGELKALFNEILTVDSINAKKGRNFLRDALRIGVAQHIRPALEELISAFSWEQITKLSIAAVTSAPDSVLRDIGPAILEASVRYSENAVHSQGTSSIELNIQLAKVYGDLRTRNPFYEGLLQLEKLKMNQDVNARDFLTFNDARGFIETNYLLQTDPLLYRIGLLQAYRIVRSWHQWMIFSKPQWIQFPLDLSVQLENLKRRREEWTIINLQRLDILPGTTDLVKKNA